MWELELHFLGWNLALWSDLVIVLDWICMSLFLSSSLALAMMGITFCLFSPFLTL